jgi:hypothetical protein
MGILDGTIAKAESTGVDKLKAALLALEQQGGAELQPLVATARTALDGLLGELNQDALVLVDRLRAAELALVDRLELAGHNLIADIAQYKVGLVK